MPLSKLHFQKISAPCCSFMLKFHSFFPLSLLFSFFWGGGEQKIFCVHAYYERKTQSLFRQPSRALLRALEALGFFMLSRAILASILSILIQNGIKKKKNSRSNFRRERLHVAPPLGSATAICPINQFCSRMISFPRSNDRHTYMDGCGKYNMHILISLLTVDTKC